MKTFEYRGFQPSGKPCGGLVEALDLKEAREKLAKQGILAEKVAAAGATRATYRPRPASSLSLLARGTFYRELSSLLASGLPLAQALEVLIEAPELGDTRTVLAGVRDRIREGESLAASLAVASRSVAPFEEALLEVGERTGTLDRTLAELAEFLEEHHDIQERIRSAMIYPVIVICIAVVVGTVVLGVLLPSITRMLTEANVALPWLTRVMVFLGRAVAVGGLPLLLALAAAVVYTRRRWRSERAFRVRLDRLLFQIPIFRTGYMTMANLRFARTLSALLRGGIQLVEGVGLAGRATGSPWVEALLVAEAEGIRHGQALAQVARRVPPLAGSLPGWIQAGEAGGDLIGMLEAAAHRYRRRWERFIARLLAALEPALILLVGLFVLLVALSILLPIMSMNQTLQ